MPAIACEFAKANSVSNEVTTNAGTSKSKFSECTQLVKIERYIFFGERQPFYFRSEGFLSNPPTQNKLQTVSKIKFLYLIFKLS